MHISPNDAMEMDLTDLRWMHVKLVEVRKKEIKEAEDMTFHLRLIK